MDRPLAEGLFTDHHCHGVMAHDLSRTEFESLASESSAPPPEGATAFDSQLGFLIRSRCAPVLGLEPHASPEAYLERRRALGADEVNRRLLGGAGIGTFVVETGYRGGAITGPEQTAALAGGRSAEVVRLEQIAEEVFESTRADDDFCAAFRRTLEERQREAVGFKSIAAYRCGLEIAPEAPSEEDVRREVRAWRDSGSGRLESETVIRFLLEEAVRFRKPIQFHVGYGDDDVDLHRCSPLLMTAWLRTLRGAGVDVTLLHCYPFHREAGFLAHVFPHVYADVGLAVNYTGARSGAVVEEFLELIPFHKALFSSDAFGLAELYWLGAHLFRRGYESAACRWTDAGDWSEEDARRVFRMIASENAARVYRLGG